MEKNHIFALHDKFNSDMVVAYFLQSGQVMLLLCV